MGGDRVVEAPSHAQREQPRIHQEIPQNRGISCVKFDPCSFILYTVHRESRIAVNIWSHSQQEGFENNTILLKTLKKAVEEKKLEKDGGCPVS